MFTLIRISKRILIYYYHIVTNHISQVGFVSFFTFKNTTTKTLPNNSLLVKYILIIVTIRIPNR